MQRVKHLMSTAIVSIAPDDNMEKARKIFSSGSIRHLPVVEDRTRLIGLVTQRDVLAAAHQSNDTTIAEIMQTNVKTVTSDEPLRTAAALMLEHKYGCMPVVDKGKLTGIITESDFLKLAIFPVG
ncbi:CBS domain-containing protein [Desulfovibrio inopinatus]|uniref:CBS domain-containing protein n=1 Tax=Desulfovibrio inopinatus TaxID=102109 RepID=UPI00040A53CF|nr:CBS domain-containing protein [Desulfovibrio inopinatus]